MKYKLINVKNVVDKGVTFGTCELCMSVGTLDYEVYIVKDSEGKQYEYESGGWDWGDWFEYCYDSITNVIDFAAWFSEQDLPEGLQEYAFWDVVRQYIDDVQDVQEAKE